MPDYSLDIFCHEQLRVDSCGEGDTCLVTALRGGKGVECLDQSLDGRLHVTESELADGPEGARGWVGGQQLPEPVGKVPGNKLMETN